MRKVPNHQRLLANPRDAETIAYLKERFAERRDATADQRAAFREAFYEQRARLKKDDLRGWMDLQAPFPQALDGFRQLVGTTEYEDDEQTPKGGFVTYFATSKDEASTYDLCVYHSSSGIMRPDDVRLRGRCIINRNRIIGKEKTRDKVKQMRMIAENLDIGPERVIRLNDMWFEDQQAALREAGFIHQAIIPWGYVFQPDLDRARELAEGDDSVVVLPEKDWALELGRYVEKWGL